MRMPGRETPESERSLCPEWCEEQDQADHWHHVGNTWQTIHARRFGAVAVYLPQELHDDGELWIGDIEVITDEGGVDGYTPRAALELANQLLDAARFAADIETKIRAQAEQGIVTTTPAFTKAHASA